MNIASNGNKIYQVIPVMVNSSFTASSKHVSSILIASSSPPKLNILSCSHNFTRNFTSFDATFKPSRFAFGKALTLRPIISLDRQNFRRALSLQPIISLDRRELLEKQIPKKDIQKVNLRDVTAVSSALIFWLSSSQMAYSSTDFKLNPVYEVGELFELGIQLLYVLLLLALLGVGTFFVLRQIIVRRELDLSAKELQEQVRSGDANATGLFELGAVMLRRKYYPAAIKYLNQAIDKWDGEEQDLAQVYNALGVSYVRDGKLDKGISQFEKAVKLQPGYVTAWNNLGDAYEEKKEYKAALKAFEEALLFDPNNRVARPRVDSLRVRVNMYKGVPVKVKDKSMF